MKRVIECVPNFSEARDLAKVDALVEVMGGVPGAWVLDRSSDPDHNRSVVTLAGEPEAVAEAAIRGAGKAAELIDMTRQTGAHPRIGATDVLPFIPLEGISMDECVAIARRAGREIWDRYRIPIYFYEAAAIRPKRVNLENVRAGQFEGLLQATLRDPDRSPDIGEPRLHPTAGAVAVGARKLLIAYNIHLGTNDVSIAKRIAKSIRFSSGGLRYVKALGIDLKGRNLAQVSINLTDFERTPVHRVFELVKREAERHGCTVIGSEIIGLIPRRALELSAEYYLQLENFSADRVLEHRLAALSGAAPPHPLNAAIDRLLGALAEQVNQVASTSAPNPPDEMASLHANLDRALALTELFEQFEQRVQLEAPAVPSMLADLRIGRGMALGAARGALENVETQMAAIQDLGNDFGYLGKVKSRIAAIKARLAGQPVSAGN